MMFGTFIRAGGMLSALAATVCLAQPATQQSAATTRPASSSPDAAVRTVPDIKDLPPMARPVLTQRQVPDVVPFGNPDSVDDLLGLEKAVEQTAKRTAPATVAILVGSYSGSGVIVSPDGWVLTAGHVAEEPNREVLFIFPDGRRAKGLTCGANLDTDAGLARITDAGPWPFLPMASQRSLRSGQWLLALGHPGGYQLNRPPVTRLGRLIGTTPSRRTLVTDNTLVGGDSGGPLVDLEGFVVAIHSRINPSVTANMHVPVDLFLADWDRMARGEVWGELNNDNAPSTRPQTAGTRLPYVGFREFTNVNGGVKIDSFFPDSPVEKAGLKAGDVVTHVDDQPVLTHTDIIPILVAKQPGQTLILRVIRDGQSAPLTLRVTVAPPKSPSAAAASKLP